jgi:hypothetical protein
MLWCMSEFCIGTEIAQYSDRLLAGQPGFNSCLGHESFLRCAAFRLALGFNQPLIQWAEGPGQGQLYRFAVLNLASHSSSSLMRPDVAVI